MSNLVELLAGSKLRADLRDGTKFFAEGQKGQIFAAASRSGTVALWVNGANEVDYLNVQPVKKKNNAESEVQGLWLSETGDLLYVATSVDVLAVNTYSKTIAWQYQQKRQWGFLISIPQGGYLTVDDEFTTFYSSGESVRLDRKARVLRSDDFAHSPRMIAKAPDSNVAFGSDGHLVWRWDVQEGFDSREMVLKQPCYSLQVCADGSRIAVRAMGRVIVFDSETLEGVASFPCEAGLPQLALSESAEIIAQLSGQCVIFRDLHGAVVGAFEVENEVPISIFPSLHLNGVIVGTRNGSVYSVPWPV